MFEDGVVVLDSMADKAGHSCGAVRSTLCHSANLALHTSAEQTQHLAKNSETHLQDPSQTALRRHEGTTFLQWFAPSPSPDCAGNIQRASSASQRGCSAWKHARDGHPSFLLHDVHVSRRFEGGFEEYPEYQSPAG